MMFFMVVLPTFLVNLIAAEKLQIISGLEDFNKEVISLLKQSNDIEASLPKLTLEISEAIQMDSLVTLQKETLNIAISNGEPVQECEQILQDNYISVVDELHKYVTDKISKELKKYQNVLQSIKERTDKFINKLESSEISMSEIDDIIEKSDDDFVVVGRTRHILQILVKNSLYDLDEEPTANILHDKLLKPVHKCLDDKSKIKEHKGK